MENSEEQKQVAGEGNCKYFLLLMVVSHRLRRLQSVKDLGWLYVMQSLKLLSTSIKSELWHIPEQNLWGNQGTLRTNLCITTLT